ncbi:MAG: hypothetical protein ACK5O3_16485 [Burkholderiales bacterium]|jgi:hypothetical protein
MGYALLQLCGGQLTPNILAGLGLLQAGALEQHVAVHTETPASDSAAESLTHLLAEVAASQDPAELPQFVKEPVDNHAEASYAMAQACIAESPAGTRWVLNATGATKPMSLGLVLLARHPQVEAVIYLDLDLGQWRSLGIDPELRPRDQPLAHSHPELAAWLAKAQLDSVPIHTLLQSQLGRYQLDEAKSAFHSNAAHPGVDVMGWLRKASQQRSSFRASAPNAARLPPVASEGDAFECWIAHLLLALGVHTVRWGVELRRPNGQAELEFDIAACHGSRLLCLDVKIDRPDVAGKSAQLRVALETTRRLGGLSATCGVLRPNWPAATTLRDTASDMRVLLLDRQGFTQLPSQLQRLLQLSWTPAQAELAEQLQRWLQGRQERTPQGRSVFAHGPT